MDNSLKITNRNSMLQAWAQRVKECRNSGMHAKTWCAEYNIKLSTYYTWQKKVFNAVSNEVQQNLPDFGPVFAEVPLVLPLQASTTDIAATVKIGDFSCKTFILVVQ